MAAAPRWHLGRGRQPFQYQAEVCQQTLDALLVHKNVVLGAPTGSGKTAMAQAVALDMMTSGRIQLLSWVVGSVPLLRQAAEDFLALLHSHPAATAKRFHVFLPAEDAQGNSPCDPWVTHMRLEPTLPFDGAAPGCSFPLSLLDSDCVSWLARTVPVHDHQDWIAEKRGRYSLVVERGGRILCERHCVYYRYARAEVERYLQGEDEWDAGFVRVHRAKSFSHASLFDKYRDLLSAILKGNSACLIFFSTLQSLNPAERPSGEPKRKRRKVPPRDALKAAAELLAHTDGRSLQALDEAHMHGASRTDGNPLSSCKSEAYNTNMARFLFISATPRRVRTNLAAADTKEVVCSPARVLQAGQIVPLRACVFAVRPTWWQHPGPTTAGVASQQTWEALRSSLTCKRAVEAFLTCTAAVVTAACATQSNGWRGAHLLQCGRVASVKRHGKLLRCLLDFLSASLAADSEDDACTWLLDIVWSDHCNIMDGPSQLLVRRSVLAAHRRECCSGLRDLLALPPVVHAPEMPLLDAKRLLGNGGLFATQEGRGGADSRRRSPRGPNSRGDSAIFAERQPALRRKLYGGILRPRAYASPVDRECVVRCARRCPSKATAHTGQVTSEARRPGSDHVSALERTSPLCLVRCLTHLSSV